MLCWSEAGRCFIQLQMVLCLASGASGVTPTHLRCEYLRDPQAVDQTTPRLMWRLASDQRGAKQIAYQVLVASSVEKLSRDEGDLWDSGRVESSRTTHVEYEGAELRSRQPCHWKVRVWGRGGKASIWSEPSSWTMTLLDDADWQADYISYLDMAPVHASRDRLFLPAARQYRKEFAANAKIRRATVYATALGVYELEINGVRVGDSFFAPGWTDYRQRAYYNTYDVTSMVRQGDNAIGATLADGWYSGYVAYGLLVKLGTEQIGRYCYGKTPSLMAQLEIEYEDGTYLTVPTDTTWKVTDAGPVQEADFLMGEAYDARREMPGWSQPGFDDGLWQEAIRAEENGRPQATFYSAEEPDGTGATPKIVATPRDLGFVRPRLEAYPAQPVRVTQELRPVGMAERSPGTYLFNLGQNFAGTVRLKVRGSAGQKITLRYGEMLHPDGRLMTENLRRARATDTYTCKGDPEGETYTPRFTYHGFQYVEVSNLTDKPDSDTITGLVLHSDTPLTSSFECSDPMVNQLFSNVVWTQRANFIDLPTDCPQRDERMGWTGDAQIYARTATFNADVAAFYSKWLRELMEAQFPEGQFPGFAPMPFHRGFAYGTGWSEAGVICPWTMWQVYGDTRIIERCWEPMERFVSWHHEKSPDHLGKKHGTDWGDWLNQGAVTPIEYIDTIYMATVNRMMAEMANATGRSEEAEFYLSQHQRICTAFREEYLREDGSLTVDTQTAYALAIDSGIVPEELRERIGERLAQNIARSGNRMTTGFIGTRPLLPALSASGQHDLAVFLFQSHQFPSWGYEVDQGATTIWERWDSYTKKDGFGRHNAAMNSFAHYSFGAVCEWMFRTLAGIDTEGPGFSHILVRPSPPMPGSNAEHDPIDWVNASYESIHGKIVSRWRVVDDRFHLHVTLPPNTTGTVYVPAKDVASITESGKPLSDCSFVRFVGEEDGLVALAVESGSYRFTATGGVRAATRAYAYPAEGRNDRAL